MTVEAYLHQGKMILNRWAADPRLARLSRISAVAGTGFLLSGAGLGNFPQPLVMALISVSSGWRIVTLLISGMLGYGCFWGAGGILGMIWTVLGGITCAILKTGAGRTSQWMGPALCGFFTAASGLVWLLLDREIPTLGYLLGVALAVGCARLFAQLKQQRDPVLVWLGQGIGVLALARVRLGPFGNLGYIAAGAMALKTGFPGVALCGLALDLANVSPVPMTAVVCLIWLVGMVPGIPGTWKKWVNGPCCLLVMALSGWRDPGLVLGFTLGGLCSGFLREQTEFSSRQGRTGYLQVRLELASGILQQIRQVLMEFSQPPIDEQALLDRTRERACGICPNRRSCPRLGRIPREMLHRPWVENNSLPFPCKKPGRMILELRRTQEHYRTIRADRDRQQEYRSAVIQQYGFLSEYLQSLSDSLSHESRVKQPRFRAAAAVATRSREADNGDRCMHFSGSGNAYFLLLCDGMGTGLGASREGSEALELLRRMLTAGFPAEYALQSMNSMLCLRGRAGAVTVDLVQILLDTGKTVIYKWGASPSYLLKGAETEKIGTAGPPPGISVEDTRMGIHRLSLGRGETLIIASDGVDGEELRRCAVVNPGLAAGEMAAKLLEMGAADLQDDATVAVVRLYPAALST